MWAKEKQARPHNGPDFYDLGIEYYRFVGPAARG